VLPRPVWDARIRGRLLGPKLMRNVPSMEVCTEQVQRT
jgi:hypothetical protein